WRKRSHRVLHFDNEPLSPIASTTTTTTATSTTTADCDGGGVASPVKRCKVFAGERTLPPPLSMAAAVAPVATQSLRGGSSTDTLLWRRINEVVGQTAIPTAVRTDTHLCGTRSGGLMKELIHLIASYC